MEKTRRRGLGLVGGDELEAPQRSQQAEIPRVNQFRRDLPVFNVGAMRACVLRWPQSDTKASRSRSRTYCSETICGAESGPPARMLASLRATSASYSEMYSPRSIW